MHEVADQDIQTAALKVVISASLSLFVMLVDLAFVLRDEFNLVFLHVGSSWRTALYASVRGMGLLGQMFNVYFACRMYLNIYTSPAGCYVWFSYQALIVQILLLYVEYLLGKRIFALFASSQSILMTLVSLLVAQVSSMAVSAQFSIRMNQYMPTCWVTKSSPGNAVFSATTMTTYLIIFFMTFWKFSQLPKKFTQQPLGRTIFLESMCSLTVISALMLFVTLTSLEVIKLTMNGNIMFAWLVCTLWMAIGHIRVNQEKLRRDDVLSKMWEASVPLTSQIEMGEVSMFETTRTSSNDPTASTLHVSSTASKSSQLSTSSVCTSNKPWEWTTGDVSPSQVGSGSTAPSGGCAGEATSREGDAQDDDSEDRPSSSSQPPLSGTDSRERNSGDDPSPVSCSSSSVETPVADVDEVSPSGNEDSDASHPPS